MARRNSLSAGQHDGQKLSPTELLEWIDALAAAGKKVWIIVDACDAGQLRLEESDGRKLAENDDVGGRNYNSRIVWTPTRTGQYCLVVTTYGENETGAFTLKVRQNS